MTRHTASPDASSGQAHSDFGRHLGLRTIQRGHGLCEMELDIAAHHRQYLGFVHGGVVTTLIDQTAGLAAHSLAPPDKVVVTSDMHINFTRPVLGPRISARAQVAKHGRSMVLVRVDAFDQQGRLIALGTLNFALIDAPESAR